MSSLGPAELGSTLTSRRTGSRFAALDGLRAVGALAVLTTHVGFTSSAAVVGPFAGVLARLDAGVALFFVVSGFLLYRPHVRARITGVPAPSLRRYLKHRALRILPVLWVAVVGAAVFLPPESGGRDVAAYLRHALLVQIYTTGNYVPGLSQLWSLATEVAFYLVLPLLAWLVHRRRSSSTRAWVVGTLFLLGSTPLLGALWTAWVNESDGGIRNLWLPGYIGWFGLGMALATWNAARTQGVLERSWVDELADAPLLVWTGVLAVYLIVSTPVGGPYGLDASTTGQIVTKNLAYALIGTALVFPAVAPFPRPGPAIRVLESQWVRPLGDISYGVFAYHVAILGIIERVIDHETFGGQFALLWVSTTTVSCLVAAASYRWMERPVIRWGRRHERPATTRT